MQVIYDQAPQRYNLRQQAFQQGLDELAKGLGGIGNAMAEKQATERQLALEAEKRAQEQNVADLTAAASFRDKGYDVSPEQIAKYRTGEAQATQQDFQEQEAGEMMVPRGPQVPGLFERRTKEYEDAQELKRLKEQRALKNQDLQGQLLEQNIGDKKLPFAESREAQKITLQGGIQKDIARQKVMADSIKAQKKEQKDIEERTIPGMGIVRTKKEAQEIRQSMADANDATKLIDEILELSDGVTVFDRGRVNLIESKKKILAGKLRLPLTGPGAMTEDEFKRLIETMGDPAKLFGLESIERDKLKSLKDTLKNSVMSKFAASRSDGAGSGLMQPPSQRTAGIKDFNQAAQVFSQGAIDKRQLTDEELDYLLGLGQQGAYGFSR